VIEGMEDLITDTQTATRLTVDAVMSNGMGFGGQNTSVVFRKYDA
jgi:3-oxoacyl-(acyl-carrier-protein) synthase